MMGWQTVAREQNTTLRGKICGPRGTFQFKTCFLTTVERKKIGKKLTTRLLV